MILNQIQLPMTKILRILILLIFFNFDAIAQNSKTSDVKYNIYNIESISSKANGKSLAISKNIATTNARRDAFMVLLMRLQLPIATADDVTNEEIAEMVRSEQIVDEKSVGNSYSANYNIAFAKDFVDHILKSKNKDEENVTKLSNTENYVIIPVKMIKKRPLIWEQENDWMAMFKRVINKNNSGKQFIVPEGNFENVAIVNGQNVSNISYDDMQKIIENYNAQSIYLLYYNLDEIANKALVEVTYLRKLQKKQFRLSFVNVDHLPYNDLVIRVAERTFEYIKNNPIGSDNALNKNFIDLFIRISSIDDWLNMKSTFDKAKFVDSYEIKSISKDQVKLSINYLNTQTPFEKELQKLGLNFSKRDESSFDINAISQ